VLADNVPGGYGVWSEDDGNTQVLYFRNATAIFSSFTAAPETLEL